MSYARSKKEREKIEKLSHETFHNWYSGAYYNEDKQRFVKYGPKGQRAKTRKYFKKYSNKRVRRVDSHNGGSYKKSWDFWWNLF